MQVGVLVHPHQRLLHGVAHAHLVDVAHVEHFQTHFVHEALFARVHTADADLAHHVGRDGRRVAADAGELGRPVAAQAGHRHAVDVAAGGEFGGVEVGVRVQPQHAELLAGFAAVAGHRADGPHAQAVVAPQHDGQSALGEFGVHRVVQCGVPCHHFGQVAVTVDRRLPGVGRAAQVATVDHLQAVALQHRLQAGHAQGLGPHGGAARAGADVGGNANEADG